MSRQRRFECKLQCFVPVEHAEAIEAMAQAHLLDVSAVLRMAIVAYLHQHGFAPKAPRPNGHAPVTESARHG